MTKRRKQLDFAKSTFKTKSAYKLKSLKQIHNFVLLYDYEGHSRINDNEFISRKVLLDSVLLVMSYEDTYITYSCLKFVAFIMSRLDAMII